MQHAKEAWADGVGGKDGNHDFVRPRMASPKILAQWKPGVYLCTPWSQEVQDEKTCMGQTLPAVVVATATNKTHQGGGRKDRANPLHDTCVLTPGYYHCWSLHCNYLCTCPKPHAIAKEVDLRVSGQACDQAKCFVYFGGSAGVEHAELVIEIERRIGLAFAQLRRKLQQGSKTARVRHYSSRSECVRPNRSVSRLDW